MKQTVDLFLAGLGSVAGALLVGALVIVLVVGWGNVIAGDPLGWNDPSPEQLAEEAYYRDSQYDSIDYARALWPEPGRWLLD